MSKYTKAKEKSKEGKILELDISEAEFDKCVTETGLGILDQTDEYILYAQAFGDAIKYKNYRNGDKDGFKIVQIVPEEVACGKCHIKIHTAYYDGCPTCGSSTGEMLDRNRAYNDEMHDFSMDMNKEFQDKHAKKQGELIEKYGFDF